jgi:hypothetical protein
MTFPFFSSFPHKVVIVLVVLKGEIDAADDGLIDIDILADKRVHEVVSLVQSDSIVDDFFEFEGILILTPSSSHEVNKLRYSSLVK